MRKTLGVCLLVLLSTVPSTAGEIPNDRPAPPEPANYTQESTDGVMFQGATTTPDEPESLTLVTLELLAVLPSIL